MSGLSSTNQHAATAGHSNSRTFHRMWVVPITTALALVGGFVYLAAVKPLYAVEATLALSNRDLTHEARAVQSAAAEVDGPRHDLANLQVRAIPEKSLLVLSLESAQPRQAAELLNRVVDRYINRPAAEPATHSADPRIMQLVAARTKVHQELTACKKASPTLAEQNLKPMRDRVATLMHAQTAAQIEATSAKAILDATVGMLDDPAKAADLISANRSKGIFSSLDRQTAQIQDELAKLEARLEQQKRTMMAQNPTRIATQQQVDVVRQRLAKQQRRYVEVYRTVLQQQWQAALNKQKDLDKLIDQQKQQLNDTEQQLAKLNDLEDSAKAADHALAQATGQPVNDISDVRIVATAQAPKKPVWPDRSKVLWIAMAVGALTGILLSFVRIGGA